MVNKKKTCKKVGTSLCSFMKGLYPHKPFWRHFNLEVPFFSRHSKFRWKSTMGFQKYIVFKGEGNSRRQSIIVVWWGWNIWIFKRAFRKLILLFKQCTSKMAVKVNYYISNKWKKGLLCFSFLLLETHSIFYEGIIMKIQKRTFFTLIANINAPLLPSDKEKGSNIEDIWSAIL